MKLFFKILLCFYVVLSFLDAANDSLILDGNVYDEVDDLLSDGKPGEEVGSDVKLSGSGRINLTLNDGELIFKVCSTCAAKSRVCFETTENRIQKELECSGIPSYCTFEVHKEGEKIFFGDASVLKQDFGGSCLYPKIHTGYVTAVGTSKFESCEPKIVDKMIKLYVSIDPLCPITVINAKIHEPPTTTMSPTKMPQPTQSPPKDNSAEASSFPDWGYAVIGIALLIVILIIGFVVYYLYRKRQTSKRVPPNVDQKQPKSAKAKDATIEIPTKKDDDVEAAKIEPKKSQKKEKKTKTIEAKTAEDIPEPAAKQNLEAAKIEPKKIQKKEKKATQEPTTTEDIPPPTAKQPEPSPPKQLPRPNPAACSVRRLIPRGMKSAKTDSLDETLKIDKTAMIESTVVCAEKHCLEADESDVLNKMKADYPTNIQHDVLPSEVDLLCLPVSKMFKEMDSMARDSEQKLSDVGCEFDERHCIVTVSDEARQFLKAKTTDATTVYFAFGAEYHEYITDRSDLSIPLLYVFALQPRFSETSRRKACATLRRQLVKVLGYYKCADRAKMPFPINIVEAAYCKDPKYFYEPSEIKTDSGRHGPKIMKNGDGKRKKKSTKKH